MSSFREMKSRIGSVENIQQITRAMKMVAGARLRRSEQAVVALRPFASRLDGMCARFLRDAVEARHPFFEEREVRNVAAVVIASDRGLCGSYNNRILERMRRIMAERAQQRFRLFAVGKKATERLRHAGCEVEHAYGDVFNPVRFSTAEDIGGELQRLFLAQEVDEVTVLFTEYFSPLRQVVTARRLLPCSPELTARRVEEEAGRPLPVGMSDEAERFEQAGGHVYIYEPDYGAISDVLLEYNVNVQLYRALLEAQSSEHGARMMAMDNATENAEEMIEELTLLMNRVRQENITREILDVVGGAEAIK